MVARNSRDALITATHGTRHLREVTGPLGERVAAHWGVLGDGQTAVIEMAAASGLPLLTPEQRNPRISTTYGTGELMREALDAGLRKSSSASAEVRPTTAEVLN